MSLHILNQLDTPVFKTDFQEAALQQNSTVGIGTRLYGDVCLRGYLFPVAQKLNNDLELSLLDRQRLSGVPDMFLEVHYFGDLTSDERALSLNGLNKLYDAGHLDSIIQTTNSRRYEVRKNIIEYVLDKY